MDSHSPFLSGLLNATFRVMAEVVPPLAETPAPEAERLMTRLGGQLAQEGWFYGALLCERPDEAFRQDSLAMYDPLAEALGAPVVRILSGKGRVLLETQEILRRSSRQVPLCAVSGDALPLEDSYTDSVTALKLAKSNFPDLEMGATVNTSKYTAPDIALSYAKVARKLRHGAKFLFAQASWDMAKAQELQWCLQLRDSMAPVVARVLWISPEELAGHALILPPGVCLPELHLRKLRAEYAKSEADGRRFQARRLALIMTGFRRLGFSGVLLAGKHTDRDREALHEEYEKANLALPDYDAWCAYWRGECLLEMMPPVGTRRYLFANPLSPHGRDPEGITYAPEAALEIGKVSTKDWLLSSLLRFAARPRTGEALREILCFLCGVKSDSLPLLGQTEFLPNGSCPKGLLEGACGNVTGEGVCECGGGPCYFRRVQALAAARGDLDMLER